MQCRAGRRGSAWLRGDHEIKRGQCNRDLPEMLSDETLQAITVDRALCDPATHREAQTRASAGRRPDVSDEPVGMAANPAKSGVELGFRKQARGARETLRTHRGTAIGTARRRVPGQGIRRLRPLARRADRTFRPSAVAMRARKPWVRALLRRPGW
jgi:hypothetical protein